MKWLSPLHETKESWQCGSAGHRHQSKTIQQAASAQAEGYHPGTGRIIHHQWLWRRCRCRLNPDYTLIPIDGEPLVGRTSGSAGPEQANSREYTKNRDRERASSGLYGWKLAGVINIITDTI